MNALDTNVLVRFLLQDDLTQANKVKDLFLDAEQREEEFLVTSPVVLELIWVLDSVYEYERKEILDALEALMTLSILRFDERDVISSLISKGRSSREGLPDLLISLTGKAHGAKKTWALHRRAAKLDLFERLQRFFLVSKGSS